MMFNQTARLSKLLLLMEKDEAGQFKGKNLDEINLNMEDNLMDEGNDVEPEENASQEEREDGNLSNEEETDTPAIIAHKEKPKIKRVLVPWTEQQKKIVLKYFHSY